MTDHRTLELVGLGRLELPTSRLSGVRSNHLSYRPRSPALMRDPKERETETAVSRQMGRDFRPDIPMTNRYGCEMQAHEGSSLERR
jgi:hypothetical protein